MSSFRLKSVCESYNCLSGQLDTRVSGVALGGRLRFQICDVGELSVESVHSGRTRGGLILSSDQAVASANVIDGLAAWVSVSRSLKVKGAGLRAGSKDGPLQVTLHASQGSVRSLPALNCSFLLSRHFLDKTGEVQLHWDTANRNEAALSLRVCSPEGDKLLGGFLAGGFIKAEGCLRWTSSPSLTRLLIGREFNLGKPASDSAAETAAT